MMIEPRGLLLRLKLSTIVVTVIAVGRLVLSPMLQQVNERRRACCAAAMVAHLAKPITPDELVAVILEQLAMARPYPKIA